MSTLLCEAGLMPDQMRNRADEFMAKISLLCQQLHLDLSQFQADHIALRVNDEKLAQLAEIEWQKEAQVILKGQVNGRPIVVLEFDQPFSAGQWQVECLELPYPAPGKIYPSQDWEHVEFVVPSHAQLSHVQTAEQYLSDLKQQFPEFSSNFARLSDQGIQVKLSSPQGENERLSNPTVAFKWDGVCIKLHPHSLKDVVESER